MKKKTQTKIECNSVDASELEKARRCVSKGLRALLPPKWSDTLSFCKANRKLSSSESATTGKFSTDLTPYADEWYSAYDDPVVDQVTIVAGAQLGKSLYLSNLILSSICLHPRPSMMLWPTLDDAQKYCKGRLKTLLSQPCVKRFVGKEKTNTNRCQVRYRGGSLLLVGSNNPSALASNPISLLLCDEVDRINGQTDEGSAVELAKARTLSFFNRKIVMTSTPTSAASSQIMAEYKQGSQEWYCYRCRECGRMSPMRFDLLSEYKYDSKEKKVTTPLTMACAHCGCLSSEKELKERLRRREFEWVPEQPQIRRHRSFRLNSFYSPFIDWEYIIGKWETAKNDPQRKKVIMNTLFGEPFEDVEVDREKQNELLYSRRQYEAEVPDGVEKLVAGIDTQDHYLQYTVYGYGRSSGLCMVDSGKVTGIPSDSSTFDDLKALLARKWSDKAGNLYGLSGACIDTGGHYTGTIYDYVYALRHNQPRLFAIKGRGGDNLPEVSPPSEVFCDLKKHKGIQLHTLGVDAIKARVMAMLGDDAITYPRYDYVDDKFFAQLLSEQLTYVNGRPRWIKVNTRNEQLDCLVYALACFVILGVKIPATRQTFVPKARQPEQREKAAPAPNTGLPAQSQPQRRQQIRRGGRGFNPWSGGGFGI